MCTQFLSDEASLLEYRGRKDRPRWVPRTSVTECAKNSENEHTHESLPSGLFAHPISSDKTSDGGSIGRPAKELPEEKIRELYAQGASVTEIHEQLETEGYELSRRTIYNILSGQRVLI
jgi:hypothetical protein